MQDLLPLDAYERTPTIAFWRTALVTAAMWALAIALLVVVTTQSTHGLGALLGIIAVPAVAFGVLVTSWIRRIIRKRSRRLYRTDPAVVPPAPSGHFDYRLMCSVMTSPRFSVGGHLYIGHESWVFVPHRWNLPAHRSQIVIQPTTGVVLERPTVGPWWLARFLANRPLLTLRVRSAARDLTIQAPELEQVSATLQRYIAGGVP
jgi:hypothetical protein